MKIGIFSYFKIKTCKLGFFFLLKKNNCFQQPERNLLALSSDGNLRRYTWNGCGLSIGALTILFSSGLESIAATSDSVKFELDSVYIFLCRSPSFCSSDFADWKEIQVFC